MICMVLAVLFFINSAVPAVASNVVLIPILAISLLVSRVILGFLILLISFIFSPIFDLFIGLRVGLKA